MQAEDIAFLQRSVPYAEFVLTDSSGSPQALAKHVRLLEVVDKIDYAALLQGAAYLALLTEPSWLERLQQSLSLLNTRQPHARVQGDVLLQLKTDAGLLLIGGPGNNRYQTDALIIDLGGDDVYLQQPRQVLPALSLIMDLAGQDYYAATHAQAQGAGYFGLALLLDRQGNDEYFAQQFAQGSGLFGVGILLDEAGDDRYVAQAYAQGSGVWGLGLLLDQQGQDQYQAASFAQAFARALRVGAVVRSSWK